jgi:hypothetical protein
MLALVVQSGGIKTSIEQLSVIVIPHMGDDDNGEFGYMRSLNAASQLCLVSFYQLL